MCWPLSGNPNKKEPNHRSQRGGTFQRSGAHYGVFLPEVLMPIFFLDIVCSMYAGKRAHAQGVAGVVALRKRTLRTPGPLTLSLEV
jgi:hypothetical protein